jgi:acyl transferase domain-containing protein/phosphopantetheinyl transferase (holo-ACP synthase)
MGCIFPGARDLASYWKNIVTGTSAIRDIPQSRWNPANYDLKCGRGGFIDGLTDLDPLALGIMPAAVQEGDAEQFLVFSVIHSSLRDAERGRLHGAQHNGDANNASANGASANGAFANGAFANGSHKAPRRSEPAFAREAPERTDVVIGRGGGPLANNVEVGYLRMEGIAQIMELLRQASPHLSPDELAEIRRRLVDSVPRQTTESLASVVPNITSGRVANRLDFMGTNYIVDAACASSLIAVDNVMRSLRDGRCDLGIAAGVSTSQKPHFWYAFEGLNALSVSETSRPFSANADGLLIGEGIGAVVLKRLSDAKRDGDRVYALLRGVGVSSDGRGAGLMAPRLDGQVLALQRAYEETGIDPGSISLIEAHGTGTPIGDATEIQTLHEVFGREGYPEVALGSVKSMIGHTMPAAGMAGLIKTALAIHHRVLPPTLNVDKVHPALQGSRLYLNTQARPWIASPDAPLRAGINAFGFGGINAHAILEAPTRETAFDEAPSSHSAKRSVENLTPRSSEVFVMASPTREALRQRIALWNGVLSQLPEAELRDVAYTESLHVEESAPVRLAIVARDVNDLADKLRQAHDRLLRDESESWTEADAIYFRSSRYAGKVAVLFPGLGFPGLAAGYTERLAELCLHFPVVQQCVQFANDTCPPDEKVEYPLHHQFFPPPLIDARAMARIERELAWSPRTSHGMMAANMATWQLVQEMGIRPDISVGFSLGEWSALVASGVLDGKQLLQFANVVSQSYAGENAAFRDDAWGSWAMIATSAEGAEAVLQEIEGTIGITMDVAPNQVFIGGETVAVRAAIERFKAMGIWGQELPFPATHTPLARGVVERLQSYKDVLSANAPQHSVYSGTNAAPYSDKPDEILDELFESVAHPVRIRSTISRLYDDGVRIFIQLGSGGKLLLNIQNTLGELPHEAVSIDRDKYSGLQGFHHMMAQLTVLGVPMTLSTLYRDRPCSRVELDQGSGSVSHSNGRVLSLAPPRMHPSESDIEYLQQALHPPTASENSVVVEKIVERVVEVAAPTSVAPASVAQPTPLTAAQAVLAESMRTMQQFLDMERQHEESETRLLAQYLQTQSEMMSQFLSAPPLPSAPPLAPYAVPPVYENGAAHANGHTSVDGVAVTNSAQPQPAAQPSPITPPAYPFVGEIEHFVVGQELDYRLLLDLDEHLFLPDHSLVRAPDHLKAPEKRLPTLPMTGSIEIVAEAAATLVPELKVVAVHDVEARRWIALRDERQLSLRVRARRVADTEVEVEIYAGNEKTWSFRGIVTLGADWLPAPQPLRLNHDRPCPHTPQQVYREGRLFHGPRFQVIKRFTGMSDNSIGADLEVRDQQDMFASPLRTPLLIDPILLDGMGQSAGYRAQLDGSTLFPVRMAYVSLHGPMPPAGSMVHAEVHYRPVDPRRIEGDIDVYNNQGQIWMHVEAWQIWRLMLPLEFQQVTWQPDERCLAVPVSLNDERVTCCHVNTRMLGEANIDWLYRLYLTDEETAIYESNPRMDWLLGRVAAKDAVRSRIKQLSGVALHPLEIHISNLPHGAPVFTSPGGEQWSLSISHIKDEAMAAVSEYSGVGIDLVRVTRREPQLMNVAFDEAERQLLSTTTNSIMWLHRAWCAKEAAAKAHRLGLESMAQFRLRSIEEGSGIIHIEYLPQQKTLPVRTWLDNDRARAFVTLD